ncbi:hypothetical protein THF1C08_560002 [Vibrio jasicida]|uniref:Uncharacterized protein n=1 Tax=Vibrio jasicida TaxID=766224 RepID=A0AAU9QUL6_9VIBR|nr:hypothetical protein THF1C08_560002 [Vibrio jasicida]CAH1602338.1 hypothetical protein THF1A12_570002 [Vibrio jasicida]
MGLHQETSKSLCLVWRGLSRDWYWYLSTIDQVQLGPVELSNSPPYQTQNRRHKKARVELGLLSF